MLPHPEGPKHRIRYTEGRLLGFSYDFGVTRNSSSNADAIVLASGGRPGGNASQMRTG
jgi:hypothetical protein